MVENWITMKGTHILVDEDNKEASIEKFLNKHGKSLKKIYQKALEEAKKTDNKVMEKPKIDRKKLPKRQQKNLDFLDSCAKNPNLEKIESPDKRFIAYYGKNEGFSCFFDKETGKAIVDNKELDKIEEDFMNKKWKERTKGMTLEKKLKDAEKGMSENDRRTIAHLKNRTYKGK
jgi:hypothetical protein